MAEILFNEIVDKIGLTPFHAIRINTDTSFNAPSNNDIIFTILEQGSSFKITPVTRQSHWGELVVLGFKIDATCILPFNDFANDYFSVFEDLMSKGYFVDFYFGTAKYGTEEDPINATLGFSIRVRNYQQTDTSQRLGHSIEFETIEKRTRLMLKFNGFVRAISTNF